MIPGRVEDVDRFRATVVTSLEALIGAHSSQRIVVVCHGGVINTWTAHVLGMEKTLFFDPTYTGISRFLAWEKTFSPAGPMEMQRSSCRS